MLSAGKLSHADKNDSLNYNAGHTHQKRRQRSLGSLRVLHSRRSVYSTIYSHRCTSEGPNKATGAAYTHVAIVDVPNEEEIEEEL